MQPGERSKQRRPSTSEPLGPLEVPIGSKRYADANITPPNSQAKFGKTLLDVSIRDTVFLVSAEPHELDMLRKSQEISQRKSSRQFLFFWIQDCSIEKVAILFANPKGKTTLIFDFLAFVWLQVCVATGYLPCDVLPALFHVCVAEPLLNGVLDNKLLLYYNWHK